MATPDTRLMVVDDHPLMRHGLISILNAQPGFQVVAEAKDGETAIPLFLRTRPDLCFMDLQLPGLTGADAIRAIRRQLPEGRFIVLTIHAGDANIHEALDAGASGYLLKGMTHDEILAAVHLVNGGSRFVPASVSRVLSDGAPLPSFTPRERDVLEMLVRGEDNSEIAAVLGIKLTTVKWFVKGILGKLYAANRTKAALSALERGIVRYRP